MSNLLFEMERKFVSGSGDEPLIRLHRRMAKVIDDAGYYVHNPVGEAYSETRTDLEASVRQDADDETACIQSVLKPVVYRKTDGGTLILVQKGVVIV
jgi:hypothetical protein